MSWTPSLGMVGPSYWAYMAAVMAKVLERISKEGKVPKDAVPPAVLDDAREFFKRAIAGAEGGVKETSATVNAYVIAVDAMWEAVQPTPATSEDIETILREYAYLVERLAEEGPLSPEEVVTATQLRRFFFSLHQAGEAEAYVDQTRLEKNRSTLPFLT